jgi:1-acyl-sn-glycerol-3-phosphate acyltransferase
MLYLRAAMFYLGLALVTIIYLPITQLLWPFPIAVRFRIISKWSVINLWWLKLTCNLVYEVVGRETIPAGAGIIMCKHQSAWETLALQLVFPAQVWVLKRELLWIPIYGWCLAAMQPIAIDRKSGVRAMRRVIATGRRRLDEGLWIVIFPEGTRVAPGERGKYQAGGGLLAEQLQCPVVPVAHNAGYFWPRNSFRKWPGTIRMIIGPAIETRGKSAREITDAVEEWIEASVDRLPKPVFDRGGA